MSSHNTYRRHDGVIGTGFEILHAGRRQHSVAWPDGPAQRYMAEEMKRKHITVVEGASDHGERAAANAASSSPAPSVATETADVSDENQEVSEAQAIRDYLTANPKATNKETIAAMAEEGITVTSSQVSAQRKNLDQ